MALLGRGPDLGPCSSEPQALQGAGGLAGGSTSEPSVCDDPDRRGDPSRRAGRAGADSPSGSGQPLVLCYLEGMTHERAARELRCPVGTVRSRLARGRALLQKRIARRGLVSPAAALGVVLESTSRAAALPPQIPRSFNQGRGTIVSGIRPSTGVGPGMSASVAALLEGVLIVMRVKTLASLAAAFRRRGNPGHGCCRVPLAQRPDRPGTTWTLNRDSQGRPVSGPDGEIRLARGSRSPVPRPT